MRAGVTLLELIIVVTVLAILAGALMPVFSTMFHREAEEETWDELELLAAATREHFRDTWSLPEDFDDLTTDAGATGWAGPYVGELSETNAETDGWRRAYRWRIEIPEGGLPASVVEVASSGPGGVFDDGDDLVVTVDVHPIRRQVTMARLEVINIAIERYNAERLSTDPLPGNYASLLEELVAEGFLPSEAGFQVDGWGEPFAPYPTSASPVTQVGSARVNQSPAKGH